MSESFAPIKKSIEDINCELIKNIIVADIYKDENGKSITTKILFAHNEKTLTKEEVAVFVNEIIESLKKQNIELKN